jgi:hypothetical protein
MRFNERSIFSGQFSTLKYPPPCHAVSFVTFFLPSATYFCHGTKVGKKPFPQTPGGLIFREYPSCMLKRRWPVRDKGVIRDIAKRNGAENPFLYRVFIDVDFLGHTDDHAQEF